MKLLKLTYFALLTLLAGGCVQTSAQTVLGKHPADVVVPTFLEQNGNANTILNGLSAYGTVPLALPGGLTLGGVTMTAWPSVQIAPGTINSNAFDGPTAAQLALAGQWVGNGDVLTLSGDEGTYIAFTALLPPYSTPVTNFLGFNPNDGSLVFSGTVAAQCFEIQGDDSLPWNAPQGFVGLGSRLTDLNGAAIQAGTINSNAFDGPTAAQLALAGQAPALANVVTNGGQATLVGWTGGSPGNVLDIQPTVDNDNAIVVHALGTSAPAFVVDPLGNVSAPTFSGDGSGLANLSGANIQAGTINSNALDAPTAAQLALAGQAPVLTMNDLAGISGAGFSVVNWSDPVVPTLVWNGIYNSPAFASIQAPSPYELDIGGISGTSQMMKVVRNQSSAYIQFGGFSVSFNCEAPVYSASGFSGSGAGLTTLNGAAIQAGTVNSNSFDAATQIALAGAANVLTNGGQATLVGWTGGSPGNVLDITPTVDSDNAIVVHALGTSAPAFVVDPLGNVSAPTFSGDGSGLANLSGANIQAGTINSNALDGPTAAQLALAGQAPSHVPYTAITGAPWLTLASQGVFGPAINGNTVNGFGSLANLASGTANTAEGFEALSGMNSGNDNVALGYEAMSGLWSGSANIAIGASALALCSTASGNIAVGYLAGSSIRNSNNIDIGNTGQSSDAGVVRIGTPGTHAATYLAGCVFANGGGLTNIPVTAFAATNAPQPGYYLRVDKTGTNLYYSPN